MITTPQSAKLCQEIYSWGKARTIISFRRFQRLKCTMPLLKAHLVWSHELRRSWRPYHAIVASFSWELLKIGLAKYAEQHNTTRRPNSPRAQLQPSSVSNLRSGQPSSFGNLRHFSQVTDHGYWSRALASYHPMHLSHGVKVQVKMLGYPYGDKVYTCTWIKWRWIGNKDDPILLP